MSAASIGRAIDRFLALPTKVAFLEKGVKYIMAQVDQLAAALSGISSEVDEVLAEVSRLEQALQEEQNNTPPEVDLTPLIDQATAIRARLEAVSTTASDPSVPIPAPEEPAAPEPAPQPVPEPAAEEPAPAPENGGVAGEETGGTTTDLEEEPLPDPLAPEENEPAQDPDKPAE